MSRWAGRSSALALCLVVAGCFPKQWDVVRGPGPESVVNAVRRGGQVRVELVSGQVVTLYRSQVVRDSVIGTDATREVGNRRVAFALAQVRTAERWVPRKGRGLAIMLTATAVFVFFLVSVAPG